jgi:hypothetical protein
MFLCLLVPSQKEMMRIFSMIKSGLCLARLNHPLTCWSPLKDYDEHVLVDEAIQHLNDVRVLELSKERDFLWLCKK